MLNFWSLGVASSAKDGKHPMIEVLDRRETSLEELRFVFWGRINVIILWDCPEKVEGKKYSFAKNLTVSVYFIPKASWGGLKSANG